MNKQTKKDKKILIVKDLSQRNPEDKNYTSYPYALMDMLEGFKPEAYGMMMVIYSYTQSESDRVGKVSLSDLKSSSLCTGAKMEKWIKFLLDKNLILEQKEGEKRFFYPNMPLIEEAQREYVKRTGLKPRK